MDGKEKPRFKEGDRVMVYLPGGSHPGKIRGLVTENLIDVWIVEFDNGSPDPVHYPWTCAAIPHPAIERRV